MNSKLLPPEGCGRSLNSDRSGRSSAHHKCLQSALRLLGRRDHSQAELVQKLRLRGFEPSQIEGALMECRRLDYLNDERCCKIFIEQLRRKGYGIQRIAHVLRGKGLSIDLIETQLESCSGDEAQTADCRQALAGKSLAATEGSALSEAAKARLYRFLLQRGFASSIVFKVLNERIQER